MFTILLHSSKTMRSGYDRPASQDYQPPRLIDKASQLAGYIQSLSAHQIAKHMQLSPAMATKVYRLWQDHNDDPDHQQPAIDSFLGDIYSGLQVDSLSQSDRLYADQHLLILSGLYGGLRALDGICPYRLEMGYRFADKPYDNLYKFWAGDIARLIPASSPIVNLSAVEYTKAVLPHLPSSMVITPKFLTTHADTGQPKFVTVHAKIARGAYAHWLISRRINRLDDLALFDQLGYQFDTTLSTQIEPVFVAKQFQGLGLSVRQRKS